MGSWHHSNIREKVPGINVKGAFDIREEAAGKAKENGIVAYTGVDELLADAEIEIVTIATPNDFHKPLAIKCLEAGKTVISEKPVTLNSAELEDIIAVAKKTGKLFSVHQNRRWDRDYRIVKEVLDTGAIGFPYFIESRVQGSRRSMHGWRGYKLNGGGMLLDWGVHLLDQLVQMIDSPVTQVNAHLFRLFSGEVDDNIKIFLRFANGVSAVTEMSTNCFIPHPRWHVSCSEGTMTVDDWSCNGKITKLAVEGEMVWEDDIVYTEAGPTRTMAPRPAHTVEECPLPDVKSDWSEYYKNILDVLDNKAELIVKPEQTLRVMKVVDLAFLSNETGEAIKCNI
jgi:predicted dehydrogenase